MGPDSCSCTEPGLKTAAMAALAIIDTASEVAAVVALEAASWAADTTA